MNILCGEEDPLLLGFPSPSPRSLAENDGAPIIGNELCWNPGLECRPPDDRTRVSVCFAPLDYADQQTCLFQAGKELTNRASAGTTCHSNLFRALVQSAHVSLSSVTRH